MLLAFERGAKLIVTVGSHFNLTEFLGKDRDGMSSTFLTRLRVGDILVDTKGVSRLYTPDAQQLPGPDAAARRAGDRRDRGAQLAPARASRRPAVVEAAGAFDGG